MPRKRKANEYLPKQEGYSKVREAATARELYSAGEGGPAVTTISSKNQITLPAQLMRDMGLQPGDRLAVGREGSRLVLRPRPRDWVRHYAGSLGGLYGGGREEIDHYLKDLRDDGPRTQEVEGAWADRSRNTKE